MDPHNPCSRINLMQYNIHNPDFSVQKDKMLIYIYKHAIERSNYIGVTLITITPFL